MSSTQFSPKQHEILVKTSQLENLNGILLLHHLYKAPEY